MQSQAYRQLLADNRPKYRQFQPCYTAAIAYCDFRTNASSTPPPALAINTAQAALAASGFGRIPE